MQVEGKEARVGRKSFQYKPDIHKRIGERKENCICVQESLG